MNTNKNSMSHEIEAITSARQSECSPVVTDYCMPQTDELQTSFGRRIYIHEQSFEDLAAQSIDSANLIIPALSSIPVIKLFHHMVLDDGVLFNQIDKQRAGPLLAAITEHWSNDVTIAFRKIGYRPIDVGQQSGFFNIISQNESVVATCFDINYYTFATTTAAAVRMYQDNEDIQIVKSLLRNKKGHQDLTLIKGRSLSLIDPRIGVGDGKAKHYFSKERKSSKISTDEIIEIKKHTRLVIREELASLIEKNLPLPTESEKLLLDNVLETCLAAINKGILKLDM